MAVAFVCFYFSEFLIFFLTESHIIEIIIFLFLFYGNY